MSPRQSEQPDPAARAALEALVQQRRAEEDPEAYLDQLDTRDEDDRPIIPYAIRNSEFFDAFVDMCARQPQQEQDRLTPRAAQVFKCLVGTIRDAVKARIAATLSEGALVTEAEPWPEPVDGAALLDEMLATFKRYIVFPNEHAAVAVTLWAVLTHAYECFDVLPNLVAQSPTMRCGKTRLLEVLSAMVKRPIMASNVTLAAVFRVIDYWHPTLITDEADTWSKLNEELRGIFNSGHTRDGAFVLRTVGDAHDAKKFSTWAPKALGLIGKLPATMQDRSIAIEMRRRLKSEPISKLRRRERQALQTLELPPKIARWVLDHEPTLEEAGSTIDAPEALDDRAQDNWSPLLAIARVAGERWETLARHAALVISGPGVAEDASIQLELLADVWGLFAGVNAKGQQTPHLSTEVILSRLKGMPDRHYRFWRDGQGITDRQLAAVLGSFDRRIKPLTIKQDGVTMKGYRRVDFEDAVQRYLTQDDPSDVYSQSVAVTSSPSSVYAGGDGKTHPSPRGVGDGNGNPSPSSVHAGGDGVTDKESQESPEGSNREDLTNFLTVREAADRLGVDPHDLAAKVVNGTIPSTRHAGRVLISRAEVEKRRG